MLARSSEGAIYLEIAKTDQGRGLTLVPFAGTNLIRFRGSRINGLSPVGHSDKISKLTSLLRGDSSSPYCTITLFKIIHNSNH